jgi:hypothetical protein
VRVAIDGVIEGLSHILDELRCETVDDGLTTAAIVILLDGKGLLELRGFGADAYSTIGALDVAHRRMIAKVGWSA